jgi:hypothetical protein
MDNIIEFKVSPPKSGRGRAVAASDAKILIFTGVRYVRPVEPSEHLMICGSTFAEPRLMTQEESEIALDLAAY